jgi:hypothetical protein
MAEEAVLPPVVAEKLAAFERLQPEFETSFRYIQDVQGQRRFPNFSLDAVVRYLHALWVCDRKDRLLSVPRTIERYEGERCLELLHRWQAGEVTEVVEFLQRRLDSQPFSILTRQIETLQRQGDESARAPTFAAEGALIERLKHGRLVLLNRAMNLMQAFEPIFTLPPQQVLAEVQAACAHYNHQPEQIKRQQTALQTDLYAFVAHPALARRNMLAMNKLGIQVASDAADQPGRRSARVAEPTMPDRPYAEEIIKGYVEMTSLLHNNLSVHQFVYLPAAITEAVPGDQT